MQKAPITQAKPNINESDIQAVVELLRSHHLEAGSVVEKLEDQLSRYFSKKETIATANGFSAIHLSLIALGVGRSDEIIIPSFTCPALLYPVKLTGAKVVFADIEPRSFNISERSIRAVQTDKTKAVIWPHMFGFPAEVKRLDRITVIEDVAQSMGGSLNGATLGSLSDLCISSFYATKNITGGDGGAISLNDTDIASGILDLRYYGSKIVTDDAQYYNYKLHNLNAALILSQLQRINELIDERKKIADRYNVFFKELKDIDISFEGAAQSCFHKYPLLLPDRVTRDKVRTALREKGINCGLGVLYPIHEIPGAGTYSDLANTNNVWERVLCLPVYPGLDGSEVEYIIESFQEVYKKI